MRPFSAAAAPCLDPATTTELSIEAIIGQAAAAAAHAIGRALREREQGRLTSETKLAGGELIGILVQLKLTTSDALDFERIARERGEVVLAGKGIDARTATILIDGALEITAKAIRTLLN
jgi:hypothetical protein